LNSSNLKKQTLELYNDFFLVVQGMCGGLTTHMVDAIIDSELKGNFVGLGKKQTAGHALKVLQFAPK